MTVEQWIHGVGTLLPFPLDGGRATTNGDMGACRHNWRPPRLRKAPEGHNRLRHPPVQEAGPLTAPLGIEQSLPTHSCPSGFSEAARRPDRPPEGFASGKRVFVTTASRWPEAVAGCDPERPAPAGIQETQSTCREPELGPGG